jgi:hypothetical protein
LSAPHCIALMSTCTPTLSLSEKFANLRVTLNNDYLKLLFQLSSLLEDADPSTMSTSPTEQTVLRDRMTATEQSLKAAYRKWFYALEADPTSQQPCTAINQAFSGLHPLLLTRDERLFQDQHALFDKLFETHSSSAGLLYDMLSDGTDCDPSVPLEERDGKGNLWNTLISQYRLAVLFKIYFQDPNVKEVIDILLKEVPTLNAGNVMNNVMSKFMSDSRLRKLIFRIMKSKTTKIEDVMSSLQQVLATLTASPATKPASQGPNTQVIVSALKLDTKSPDVQAKVLKALERDDEKELLELYDGEQTTVSSVRALYKAIQISSAKASTTSPTENIGSMATTMNNLFEAMQSRDETKIKDVLMQSKGMFGDQNLDQFESKLKEMDSQLDQEFEQDADNEEEEEEDQADVQN